MLKRLKVLEWAAACLEAGEVPLGTARPMQLLAYLAVGGAWEARDALARLFWPDSSDRIARSNLRNLLHKASAAAPWAPIESSEHALRLQLPTDLDDFRAAVQNGDLEAAVRIGNAELLPGFERHASEPYLRWLEGEREALRTAWTKAIQALLAQTGQPLDQREMLAEAWAQRCPHDEDAVQARMAMAAERGMAGAGARIYQAFEARLQRDFGVRPSRALERLALQTADAPAAAGIVVTPAAATPAAPAGPRRSKLFGRRIELQHLGSLLADDSLRLLTLTGPGGVGKTTLMAALHEQCVARGLAGTCLVDASAAENAQEVIVAVAAALRTPSPQGPAREASLAALVRDRPCLLLIDGAEQAGLAGPLALLLERCEHMRIVLAARRRLQLDAEHVVALEGFPLPDAQETDAEVLGTNDAIAYFTAAMRQTGRTPDLARDAATVSALVRAVDGLPLALKLLAQLTPLFSLQQLLDSVRQQVGGAELADFPAIGELMPALVASFQRSWAVLAPTEQAALARLAVFPTDFDVAAARAVGRTGLPVVTSLVDASLLRSAGTGRLSLHAAIRACVLAVCPLSDEVVADYLEHYRQRLATAAALGRTRTMRPLGHLMQHDGAHVEHAWQTALQRRALPTLLSLTESLWFNAGGYGNESEWNARLTAAHDLLHEDAQAPPALRALLAACDARARYDNGHLALAAEAARNAMRLAARCRHRDALLFALDTLARARLAQHQPDEAKALMERHAALARGWPDEDPIVQSTYTLRRMLCFYLGEYEANLQLADRSLAILRRAGDADNVALISLSKAFVCAAAGDLPRAVQSVEEVVSVAASVDAHPSLLTAALYEGSMWLSKLGQLDQARSWLERADALAYNYPQPLFVRINGCLANAVHAVAANDLGRAAGPLAEALEALARGKVLVLTEPVFLEAGRWLLAKGDRPAGVAVLRAITPQKHLMPLFDAAQALLRAQGAAPEQPPRAARTSTDAEVAEVMQVATAARQRVLQLSAPARQD